MTGGGGRGGAGGSVGSDAEGTGFGGDGGNSFKDKGEDGGQELGAASGGTTTKGGSSDGNGEIKLNFTQFPDISLSWQDNSSGEDGFNIYKSTTSSPTFPNDYTQIDQVGSNTTSYTDIGVDTETLTSYAVTAFNAVGESDPVTAGLAPPVEVNGTEITAIEVDGQEISLSEVKNIEINGQDI